MKKKSIKNKSKKVSNKEYDELSEKVKNLNAELYDIKENNKNFKNVITVVAVLIIIGTVLYWLNLPRNMFLKDFISEIFLYGLVLIVNIGVTIYYLPKMIDAIFTDFGLFLSYFFIWFMLAGGWFMIFFMGMFIW
ncbi:hypothetical protein OAP76_07190 [Alphaproteobacteria bacterium]|nr:hypothetical protein [Alphaproteobacteria bacterium]